MPSVLMNLMFVPEEDGSSVSAHIDSEQLVTATILSHDDAYYIEVGARALLYDRENHFQKIP